MKKYSFKSKLLLSLSGLLMSGMASANFHPSDNQLIVGYAGSGVAKEANYSISVEMSCSSDGQGNCDTSTKIDILELIMEQLNPKTYSLYLGNLQSNAGDAPLIDMYQREPMVSSTAISTVYFNGSYYAAFSEAESKKLKLARYTRGNGSWRLLGQINSHKTSDKPSLAVFNGRLYIAFKGSSSNKIYISSTSNGTSWVPAKQIRSYQSSKSPTLAVANVGGNDRLVAAFRGSSSKKLYITGTYDGDNWSSAIKLSDQSSNAPYIAANGKYVYIAYKGASTNNIYIQRSINGGFNWEKAKKLSSAYRSNRGPAIAFHNNALHLTFKGISSNRIYRATSTDGANWSNATTMGSNKTSGSLTLWSNTPGVFGQAPSVPPKKICVRVRGRCVWREVSDE
ncbi:hypothetical protein [Pleionea sp. CnH1-48]|uniref:hypothetical protein n=1 Tax=Pleionea sp. CnH1-48 TaxID=2954494 RepID=UPI002096C8FB|nr:hypothetical protein [Pleionea sp. CnH1-48]MCO7223016.1 hypothetical protein [Pleionea sp. CnH1-48]